MLRSVGLSRLDIDKPSLGDPKFSMSRTMTVISIEPSDGKDFGVGKEHQTPTLLLFFYRWRREPTASFSRRFGVQFNA